MSACPGLAGSAEKMVGIQNTVGQSPGPGAQLSVRDQSSGRGLGPALQHILHENPPRVRPSRESDFIIFNVIGDLRGL